MARTDARQALATAERAVAAAQERGDAAALSASACLAAELLLKLGQLTEAHQRAVGALHAAEDAGEKKLLMDASAILGSIHRQRNELDDALLCHSRSLSLAREAGDTAAQADALRGIGAVAYRRNNDDEALARWREAAALYEAIGDSASASTIEGNIGLLHQRSGEHASAEGCYRRALAAKQEINDAEGMVAVLNNLGLLHIKTGDFRAALAALDECQSVAGRLGDLHSQTKAQNNIATVYQYLGEYSMATDVLMGVLDAYRGMHDKAGEARALNTLGMVAEKNGSHAEALEHFRAAHAILLDIDDHRGAATALKNMGATCRTLGDNRMALRHLEESVRLMARCGSTETVGAAHNDIGDIHTGLGAHDVAIAHYRTALDSAAATGDRLGRVESLLGMARAEMLSGRLDDARGRLDEAFEAAQALDSQPLLERAHRGLAQLCEAAGDYKSGLAHLRRAHELADTIRAEQAEAHMRTLRVRYELDAARREADGHRAHAAELSRLNAGLETAIGEKNLLIEKNLKLMDIAAHDLNNPLVCIRHLAASAAGCPPADAEERLATIRDTADGALTILGALLGGAGRSADAIALYGAPADLTKLVRSIVSAHEAAASRKSITISLQAPDVCMVRQDPAALRQVIENLVSNAVKFTRIGGAIAVAIDASGGKTRVTVRDEGPGFSGDDLQKLYHPYKRLSAAPSGEEKSTGLGLYIVKRLVTMMDGSVECMNAPGGGALFTVEL
ncbi:tetratricopeptide repeat protein [bacterium]|nr:tetratricopeptide repeat protein [bacterium]